MIYSIERVTLAQRMHWTLEDVDRLSAADLIILRAVLGGQDKARD